MNIIVHLPAVFLHLIEAHLPLIADNFIRLVHTDVHTQPEHGYP